MAMPWIKRDLLSVCLGAWGTAIRAKSQKPSSELPYIVHAWNNLISICPLTAMITVSIYFSLRFTLTEEAEGTKDFCATGVVESDGPGELSAAGLKFMDPNEKEVAVAVVVPTEGAGVMDALGDAEEKENVAAPVRLGARACLEASVAKG